MGLFVMVEVYHSLRLCCAASHELMMNAIERERETGKERGRGQTAAERQQSDGRENRNVSHRLVRDIRRGSY